MVHGDDGAYRRERLDSIQKDAPGSGGGHLVVTFVSDTNILEFVFLVGRARDNGVRYEI